MLGKHKREYGVFRRNSTSDTLEPVLDHQDLFKHYFEARFEPLPHATTKTSSVLDHQAQSDDSDNQESEWGGLSDDGHPLSVEVVDHADTATTEPEDVQISDLKSFMVGLMKTWLLFPLTDIPYRVLSLLEKYVKIRKAALPRLWKRTTLKHST